MNMDGYSQEGFKGNQVNWKIVALAQFFFIRIPYPGPYISLLLLLFRDYFLLLNFFELYSAKNRRLIILNQTKLDPVMSWVLSLRLRNHAGIFL